MNIKKTLYGVILAATISSSVPLQAMYMPEAGINLWSLQTVLNFITNLGLDSKDFLIDQGNKHPYIRNGLAGYLALCYGRALLNKHGVFQKVSEKVEKNYNTISNQLNRWEFLYGGFANLWRIPQDWIRTPLQKISKAAPTGFDRGLWVVSALANIPTLIVLNTFLKSDYFKSTMFAEFTADSASKNMALATLTGITSSLLKYGLEYAITGKDSKVNEIELYRETHENKDKKSYLTKVDLNKHVFFGELSEISKKFAEDIKNPQTRSNAPRTKLDFGVPGNGKSTNAIETALQAGATIIYITYSSDLDSKYISETAEKLKTASDEFQKIAKEHPNHICAWIVEEVDQLSLTRGVSSNIQANDSKTTNALLTEIVRIKALDNTIVFSNTNLLTDIDGAGLRRIADILEETIPPTPEQRSNYIVGYANKNKLMLDEEVVQYIISYTNGFPAYTFDLIVNQLTIFSKKNSFSPISMNEIEEVNKAILDQLGKVITSCDNAQKKINTLDSSTRENNTKALNEYVATLQNNKNNIENRARLQNVFNNLSYLQEALAHNLDKKEIIKIQSTCIESLNNHYKQLPQTAEQTYLDEQLKKLNEAKDENDIKNVATALGKYFDPKTISTGSLQKQIENLEAVLKEIAALEQHVLKNDSFYSEASCTKIKELIEALQKNCTFAVIKRTKQELRNIVTLHKDAETDLSQTTYKIKLLETRATKHQQKLVKLQEQLLEAEKLIVIKTDKISKTEEKIKTSKNKNSKLKEALEDAQKELNKAKTLVEKLLIQIEAKSKKIEDIKKDIENLNKTKIQQEADYKEFQTAQNNVIILDVEEKQKAHFDAALQCIDTLKDLKPLKYYYDFAGEIQNAIKTTKDNIAKILEVKKLQQQRLTEQSQNIITTISTLTHANKQKDFIKTEIETFKDSARTADQRNYKNIIYKLETNPTEEVLEQTIETIKKESGLNNIIVKKQKQEDTIVIYDRDDLEVESKAKDFYKKIETSLEEAKVLIRLANKQTKDVEEGDINNIYNTGYKSFNPPFWKKPFIALGKMWFKSSNYDTKNIYLAMALNNIAQANKTTVDKTKLIEFSSQARSFYDKFVQNKKFKTFSSNLISEEDYDCLLYLNGLQEETYKNMKSVIDQTLSLNDYKILMQDKLKDIKKDKNKLYFKDIKQENDITEKIKLFAFIHQIPDENPYHLKNLNDRHYNN